MASSAAPEAVAAPDARPAEAPTEREARGVLDEALGLAADALDQARSSLMIAVPFMDVALWRMPFASRSLDRAVGTDGRSLFLDPLGVIVSYRDDPNEVLRDYVHAILHCVFRHPFDGRHARTDVWDVACDIAVEATAIELVGLGFPSALDAERARAIARIRDVCPQLTAGKLYKVLLRSLLGGESAGAAAGAEAKVEAKALPRTFAEALPDLFRRDDHGVWPRTDETAPAASRYRDDDVSMMPSDGESRLDGEAEESDDDDEERRRSPGADMPGVAAPSSSSTAVEGDVDDPDAFLDIDAFVEGEESFGVLDDVELSDFSNVTWKDIGEQIELDMEAFTGKVGFNAGTFLVNLTVANRKHYDYREFLKRFSALSEEMKVSPDEFDYIYYTYGLSRYGNMPLVEPLEYQETNRIRDFVIAIDTSASCAGGLVQQFAEKTYDVLKNSEGFGHKVNIHLIQCDCDIRSDVKLTSIRDLENAFGEFSTRGYGGTDFRPVFKYVDELIETRELTNLKGLIYFTDGLGKYPVSPPDYETVFVFLDEEDRRRKVPPWAMKVVMDEDDILEL